MSFVVKTCGFGIKSGCDRFLHLGSDFSHSCRLLICIYFLRKIDFFLFVLRQCVISIIFTKLCFFRSYIKGDADCCKSMHRKAFEQGPPVGPCSNLKIEDLDPAYAAGGWFWTASTKSSVKPM